VVVIDHSNALIIGASRQPSRPDAVRRTVHGRQGNRISICRVTFDEHRSIVREPRTKPQRTGIEAPTNRGRYQPHCRNHVDARVCAWIAVNAKMYPYGPSKKLLSGGAGGGIGLESEAKELQGALEKIPRHVAGALSQLPTARINCVRMLSTAHARPALSTAE
jgi:hypothetical protein